MSTVGQNRTDGIDDVVLVFRPPENLRLKWLESLPPNIH